MPDKDRVMQAGATATLLNAGAQTAPLVDGEAVGPCPNCGTPMNAIRGSKSAICRNCGFKDSCCY